MNLRKAIVSTLATSLLLGAGAGLAYAHDRGENHKERMAKELQLTEQQQTQLQELWQARKGEHREMRDSHRSEMQALHALDPASPEFQAEVDKLIAQAQERAAERVRDHVEMQQKMQQILTPEQMTKFKEMKEHREGRHHGGKGHGDEKGERMHGKEDCR